jgi:acetolactate synthase-1/2/3 large subunit
MGIGGIKGSKFNKLIMGEADVIIAIGTSMSVAFAGYDLSYLNRDAHIYMIDVELAEIEKVQHKLTGAVIQDAKEFLVNLNNYMNILSLQSMNINDKITWLKQCLSYKTTMSAKVLAKEGNPIDIYYVAKKIDDLSRVNDILVDDAGSSYYVAGQTFSFENSVRELTSGAYASMGLAIPLSIGAAIADPKARILTLTGDGSIETNIQELKTLSYYNLNIKLFVINNGGYLSMREYGRFTEEEGIGIINLRKIAEAYDMPYFLISDYKQFDTYLPSFINNNGPAFIEVMCDDKQKLILPI